MKRNSKEIWHWAW